MVYRTIRNGRRGTPMVAFKDRLTPEQIWKIVEFLLDKGREITAVQGK
jgi:mono/diheme cytochrome c family protein